MESDSENSSESVGRIFEGEHVRIAYSHKYNAVERATLFDKAGARIKKEWDDVINDGGSYVLSLLTWQKQ